MAVEADVRKFVCDQLRDCSDLSKLTINLLRGRYLAHVGQVSLSTEDKLLMKKVVKEELIKIQDSGREDDESVSDATAMPHHKKRKREEEYVEEIELNEGMTKAARSGAKRSRIEEEKDCEKASEENENISTKMKGKKGTRECEKEAESSDSEVEMNGRIQRGSQLKECYDEVEREDIECEENNGDARSSVSGESSGEEEDIKDKVLKTSHKSPQGSDSSSHSSLEDEPEKSQPQQVQKKRKTVKKSANNEEAKDSDSSSHSSLEDEPEKKSQPQHARKKTKTVTKSVDSEGAKDSDSSSHSSLEDEPEKKSQPQQVQKKRKTVKKSANNEEAKESKEEHKVTRLKHYLSLCGVRRNYNKLFEGCRSVKSKVDVLKRELAELGVKGQPSIGKCKKARLKREQAQELADLDLSNIITTHGRPKRNVPFTTPSATYKRTVHSSSDSDEEDTHADRGRKRARDWSNLQGIISDDGDSD